MLLTCEALYDHGRVELQEHPRDIQKARVLVTFLPTDGRDAPSEARVRAALRDMRALLAPLPRDRSLVDDLIADRRMEAVHE
ncbi:MAG: hypothetical protein HY343_10850 [Lentisphaerae bacterium]|nr:hypothetical protein [Lentisphaerota bacterium]